MCAFVKLFADRKMTEL